MQVRLKDMDDYQKKIVANVSHDFRSPLTSIKGYVEAMADGTIPPELYGKLHYRSSYRGLAGSYVCLPKQKQHQA